MSETDDLPESRWTVEEADPEVDSPPEDHHAQPDEDPPDLPPLDEAETWGQS